MSGSGVAKVQPGGAGRRRRPLALLASGLALLACAGGLNLLARCDLPEPAQRSWLVALSLAAGASYLLGLSLAGLRCAAGWRLAWIAGLGAALRAVTLAGPPLLSDDFYRYLWDGAVTARGMNPYRHAPAAVRAGAAPAALLRLGAQAPQVLAGINHPELTTVYPPLAQAAFAAACCLRPWSLVAWRAVLLLFDAATLVLLVLLLRRNGLPLGLAAWYWWNPILLREGLGSAHMDVLALPFALGAILLALRRAPLGAAVSLALGSAVKVWPVLLLPLVLRPLLRRPARLLGAAGLFGLVGAAAWAPVLAAAPGRNSGFAAYAGRWQNNDGLFRLGQWLCAQGLALAAANPGQAPRYARWFVGLLLTGCLLWQAWRPISGGRDLNRRCLTLIAAAFLLSPTQFPWYYLWLLPLLALRPRAALLLYTALLPLYYWQQHWPGVVWIEHAPVWLALAAEWRPGRRSRAGGAAAGTPG